MIVTETDGSQQRFDQWSGGGALLTACVFHTSSLVKNRTELSSFSSMIFEESRPLLGDGSRNLRFDPTGKTSAQHKEGTVA